MRPPSHHPALSVPERDRRPHLLLAVGALLALGFVLAALLAGGRDDRALAAPPPVTAQVVLPPAPAPTPAPAPARDAEPRTQRVAARLPSARPAAPRRTPSAAWVAGFYPLYETAARTYDVPWVLLASIHQQETGFSTHRTTYRGLNFAGCCGGPMQFNVTNDWGDGRSTWDRFKDAFRAAPRPASYNHRTARHPSIYDDFDAIMAAAKLLRASGATPVLDGTTWRAAYDFYGHDRTGIDYASTVTARAMGWARDGFCVNCAVDPALVAAVDAAWGAPVRAAMEAEAERRAAPKAKAASR